MICMPKTPYAIAKNDITNLLFSLYKLEKFPSTVVRTFLVYGPEQKNGLIPHVIKSCLGNKKFNLTHCRQVRDFIYIDDYLSGIDQIITSKQKEFKIYNIGSGKPIKLKLLIKTILNKIKKGKPNFNKLKTRIEETKVLYPSINKIRKSLNWRPKIDLNIGLDKTINYYYKLNRK